MNSLDFTEEEIREQLAVLGYRNIPKHRLLEFKKDLDELILHPEFRHLASPPQCRSTKPLKPAYAHPSPPVVTKEKVSLCFGDGFFLHANQSNHQRQVLTPCHNREYGQGEGLLDSYAQHSVVPKLQPAVAAPSRLWAEPENEAEPDSKHHPPLSDSYVSSPDSQGGRLIKRKVLRKLGGQSLIYEESIYSENSDKMYQVQSDDTDDKDLLNSSFWSDGEREEMQKEVRVVSQGGAEHGKESGQGASEEKREVKLCDKNKESSEDGISESEDDGGEREEDEEEEKAKIAGRHGFKTSEEEKSERSSSGESEEGSEGEYDDSDDSEDEEDGEEPEEVHAESLRVGTFSKPSEESLREGLDQEKLDLCDSSEGSSGEGGGDTEDDDEELVDEDDGEEPEEVLAVPVDVGTSSKPDEEFLRVAPGQEELELHACERSEGSSEEVNDPEDEEEFEYEDSSEEEEEEGQVVQTEPENKKLVTCDKREESSEDGDHDTGGGHEETDKEQKDDDDDDEEDEKSCESPAPSLMTSGYGTFRPEELEENGGLRGEHNDGAAEDEDSRGDLSEDGGGGEDGLSLCSYSTMDVEPGDQDNERMPAEPEAGEHELQQEVEEEKGNNEDMIPLSEKQHVKPVEEEKGEENYEKKRSHDDTVPLEEEKEEGEEEERGEEHHLQEVDGSVESFSNADIRFIDSKVDMSQMTFEELCEGWEGNLRRRRKRRSADTTSSLEERLADLRLTPSPRQDPESDEEDEEEGEEEEERRSSDSLSSGISVDALETYYRSMTHSDAGIRRKPKSFIRPLANQPAMKKTDPVTKYFQYKQIWEMFKLPGQREHRALRQEIRERLAYQPPPPKPRRMFIPNTYEVPTEKKRSALRWEVRNDLANGLMPCRVSYRF